MFYFLLSLKTWTRKNASEVNIFREKISAMISVIIYQRCTSVFLLQHYAFLGIVIFIVYSTSALPLLSIRVIFPYFLFMNCFLRLRFHKYTFFYTMLL